MSTWQELKNNPRLMKIYQERCEIIRLIREWFWSKGFTETETPLAVRYPGQEPYLNPIPVTIHDTHNTRHSMYLHTSPEFSMKKLLVAGFSKIFQITKTFRNGESFGGLHNPEFTMIEWYRVPGELGQIMDDVEQLFKYVADKEKVNNQAIGDQLSVITDNRLLIAGHWERVSMKEVWKKYCGLDLDNNLTIEQLSNSVKQRGLQANADDAYEDLFFKIFLNEIEPKLGIDKPVFVYDYPAQMCSLSKLSEKDPRYAERFELYIGGMEIANAFGELTDSAEQSKRLEADKSLRKKLGKATWPVDPDFIAALKSGIPKSGLSASLEAAKAAGIALGVDRMVVLFTNAKDINDVIFNSISDQMQI